MTHAVRGLVMVSALACLCVGAPARGQGGPALKDLIEAVAKEAEPGKALDALSEAVTEKDIPALIKLADDRRPRVKYSIVRSMNKFGKRPATEPHPVPVTFVLKMLRDESPMVRMCAAFFSWRFHGTEPGLMARLVELLDDHAYSKSGPGDFNTVGCGAIHALSGFVPRSRVAYPKIAALAENGPADLERSVAIRTLGILAEKDLSWRPYLVDRLIHLVDNAKPSERGLAAARLETLKDDPRAALPVLRRALSAAGIADESIREAVRSGVTTALTAIGEKAAPALPEVIALMKDVKASRTNRESCARIILSMKAKGKPGHAAIKAIAEDLHEPAYFRERFQVFAKRLPMAGGE